MSLSSDSYGLFIDPFGGQADLESKLIRVLHDKSFVDDATRMWRALRYEQRLGFALEAGTARLLRRYRSMLRTISGDRLLHELELVLREPRPELVLLRAEQTGILREVHPSIRAGDWLGRKCELIRHVQSNGRDQIDLYLCMLVYHLAAPEAEQVLARLNMPGAAGRHVRDTVKLRESLGFLTIPGASRAVLYNHLKTYNPIAVRANALAGSPLVRYKLQLFLTHLARVRSSLSGEDLMRLGVPAGPDIGVVRESLIEARLEGRVRTRRQEEQLVRRWLAAERQD